jgi:hypothetical protein
MIGLCAAHGKYPGDRPGEQGRNGARIAGAGTATDIGSIVAKRQGVLSPPAQAAPSQVCGGV